MKSAATVSFAVTFALAWLTSPFACHVQAGTVWWNAPQIKYGRDFQQSNRNEQPMPSASQPAVALTDGYLVLRESADVRYVFSETQVMPTSDGPFAVWDSYSILWIEPNQQDLIHIAEWNPRFDIDIRRHVAFTGQPIPEHIIRDYPSQITGNILQDQPNAPIAYRMESYNQAGEMTGWCDGYTTGVSFDGSRLDALERCYSVEPVPEPASLALAILAVSVSLFARPKRLVVANFPYD